MASSSAATDDPGTRKPLIAYGAGWPDVVRLVDAINRQNDAWDFAGFIDDTPEKQGTQFMGLPILGTAAQLRMLDMSRYWFFNNVFSTTAARRMVSERMAAAGCRFATLTHPDVQTSCVTIGPGTVVSQGAYLGANVSIGAHCAVRANAVVNHDTTLEDFVFVGAGAALGGFVTARSGAYLGAACAVRERIHIDRDSVVGMGAVVVKDVPADTCVAGVPARAFLTSVSVRSSVPADQARDSA